MIEIYQDNGLLTLLARLVAGGYDYVLYTNDITPDRETTLGSLAVAPSWTDYVEVEAADFTLQSVSGHIGSFTAAPISLMNNDVAAQVAYGYAVVDPGHTILIKAARFDLAPISIPPSNGATVIPVFSERSIYP